MLRVYTDILPSLGGYLTDKDQLHFGRFEAFVRQLARNEAAYFEMKAGNVAKRAGAPAINHKRKFYLEKLGLHPRDTVGLRRLVQVTLPLPSRGRVGLVGVGLPLR